MPSWRSGAASAGASARRSIEIDSDAFLASLRVALGQLKLQSEAELWGFALATQNLARFYCPVDTGRLRSSIQATKGHDGSGPFVDIGTNVNYAGFQEFGTRYMAAQPYLRPALAVAAQQWGSFGSAGGIAGAFG